jgi:PiT family inorganic phosphate transporter
MMNSSAIFHDFQSAWQGVVSATSSGQLTLLLLALFAACAFEFINGFHDTANSVATVIYTRSLRPWAAVSWSGLCNFLGVMLGGTAVAMGIIKLLPATLLAGNMPGASMAMVFAVLGGAILWNLGTWYLGLPASSSHTLIGSILGLGLAHAYVSGAPLASGVNWGKAREIGLALLISPILGFSFAAALLALVRRFAPSTLLHSSPPSDRTPPPLIRGLLVATSSGVSFAHGSNDGQKGIGLIMLVLIALMPGQFAVRAPSSPQEAQAALAASQRVAAYLGAVSADASQLHLTAAAPAATGFSDPASALAADRLELRKNLLSTEASLAKLEKTSPERTGSSDWAGIKKDRALLKSFTDYAPSWVVAMVALALGIGTMVGWKRVVVTLGSKIGKSELTYAQGASAQFVAMSMIGASSAFGLPVSTTHVLSSGIAGTMVAGHAGLQARTVRNILLAWVLTLPAAMTLSAGLYLAFFKVFS